MYIDYFAQMDHQQHERELVTQLERRRVAAERAVQEHGSRLAALAHLAREGRAAARAAATARPVGC